jgi:glutamate dehydrogenase/leucine dehydrogenase/predicted nucleotidyltransferase
MKKTIAVLVSLVFSIFNCPLFTVYSYPGYPALRPLSVKSSAFSGIDVRLNAEGPAMQSDRFDIDKYEPVNPFLINMLNRFKRARNLLSIDQNTFRQIVEPYQIFKGSVFAEIAGKHRHALSYRIKHNITLGPGGGGMRYITTAELPADNIHFHRNPDYPVELEILGVNSLQEAEDFIDRWVFEETLALAMGMTLKNASVNLELGGAKGSVLLAYIVQRDKKFYLVPLSSASPLDDIMTVARITRDWARQLRLNGIVGVDKDKPAADINTTYNPARPQVNVIAWFADEDIEVLFEQGYFKSRHSELHNRLKVIHDNGIRGNDETHLMGTLYLQAVADYVKETGIAVEELGAYTSKPVSLGGSEVRAYSTALGMRITTEHLMKKVSAEGKKHEKPLQGTTCAIQGFGNAGKNSFDLMAEAGSNVVAVSEYGTGIYRAKGLNDVKNEIIDIVRHTGTLRSCVGEIDEVEIIEDPDNLLYMDVDILVLAAKEDVVTKENADKIRAGIISEPANGAISMAADRILAAKGIKVFHDSLVSAGGVIVSGYERIQNIRGEHWPENVIVDMLSKQLCDSADAIYDIGQNRGVDLRTAGDIYAFLRIMDAMKEKSSSAGAVYNEDFDRLWELAMGQAADKTKTKDIAYLVDLLRSGDKSAHSLFRYFLAKVLSEKLGEWDAGVSRVWLFGSVSNGNIDEVYPASDIDFIIEVDSEQNRKTVYAITRFLNDYVTDRFNQIMGDTSVKLSGLIDVADKVFLPEEIKDKKGFATAVYSLYTPATLLYNRDDSRLSGVGAACFDSNRLIRFKNFQLALNQAA